MSTQPEWSTEVEDELTSLIKDWLKTQGRTQSDLSKILNSDTTRMQSLLETLKNEFSMGGFPKVASRLCEIEQHWARTKQEKTEQPHTLEKVEVDPFGQLDLLLNEIRDNCNE